MLNFRVQLFFCMLIVSYPCSALDFNQIDDRIGEFNVLEVKLFPNPKANESTGPYNFNQRKKCPRLSEEFILLTKARAYVYFFNNELSDRSLKVVMNYAIENKEKIFKKRPFLPVLANRLVDYHEKIITTENWQQRFNKNRRPFHYEFTSYKGYNLGFYQSIGFPKPDDNCYFAHMIISAGDYHYYQDFDLNLEGFLFYFWNKAYSLNQFDEAHQFLLALIGDNKSMQSIDNESAD